MPRKRSRRMKSHTSAERSFRWRISQSSVIRHSCSTGPSRNARSSSVSSGYVSPRIRSKSGRPVKNSPSTHVVPASSATRSVSPIFGSRPMAATAFMIGVVTAIRRSGRTLKRRASAAKTTQSHTGAASPHRSAAVAAVHTQSGAPTYPSANSATIPATIVAAGWIAVRLP